MPSLHDCDHDGPCEPEMMIQMNLDAATLTALIDAIDASQPTDVLRAFRRVLAEGLESMASHAAEHIANGDVV